jgi:multicomponent Na+:H+ antiporter subunit E
MPRAAVVFATCFGFWWLLSDRYTGLSLGLALASAALVAAANRNREVFTAGFPAVPRLLAYLPWLLAQVVIANVKVARLVLDPRLPIDPVVVRVEAAATGELALMTLGNSITLTPGTVTLDVEGASLVVHSLTREGAADLASGEFTRRVARVWEGGRR